MGPRLSLPRSRPRRLTVELIVLVVIFAFGGFAGPALAAQVTQVLVVNTSSSPVPVAGTVNVGNLPSTQQVSGTVNVGNLPATQNVNVTGGSISTAEKASSVIGQTGFHSVAFLAHDIVSLGVAGQNVTAIAVDDGLSEQDNWRVFLDSANNSIKVAAGSGFSFIALPEPILASGVDIQCLSSGGCFWSIEVAGYPTS